MVGDCENKANSAQLGLAGALAELGNKCSLQDSIRPSRNLQKMDKLFFITSQTKLYFHFLYQQSACSFPPRIKHQINRTSGWGTGFVFFSTNCQGGDMVLEKR